MLILSFQGVAMPAMNNILSKWIPVSERSRSLALVYSGMYLGSVTGLAVSPILIHKFGWPSVFYSFGSLGSIWFALWLKKVSHLSFIFNDWKNKRKPSISPLPTLMKYILLFYTNFLRDCLKKCCITYDFNVLFI